MSELRHVATLYRYAGHHRLLKALLLGFERMLVADRRSTLLVLARKT